MILHVVSKCVFVHCRAELDAANFKPPPTVELWLGGPSHMAHNNRMQPADLPKNTGIVVETM